MAMLSLQIEKKNSAMKLVPFVKTKMAFLTLFQFLCRSLYFRLILITSLEIFHYIIFIYQKNQRVQMEPRKQWS